MENIKKIILYLIIFTALFIISFGQTSSIIINKQREKNTNDQWQIKTIDNFGEVGYYSDIEFYNNKIYISYYDSSGKNLKIAKIENNNITREIVDSKEDVGMYTSIEIDSIRNLHLSYYDKTNGNLKYALYKNNNWNIETVDTTGDVGLDTSIIVDSNNNPHISYYDKTNGDLKYAFYKNNNWNIETVDTKENTGLGTSIIFDSSSNPYISYSSKTDGYLYYAYKKDNNWNTNQVDTDCIVHGSTSITVDNKDNPYILYYDVKPPNEDWNLRLAYFSNSKWNIEIIQPDLKHFYNIQGSDILIDRFQRIHVCYYDWESWDLNYAYKKENIWYFESVDTERMVGSYASIAIDDEGYPHISYMDSNNLALKYAKKIQYSPEKPDKPIGPNKCKLNTECKFTTKSSDFDNDKIRYKWDFGDGEDTEWSDYYNSDEQIEVSHVWSEKDIYQIKVKAEDINGYESKWSEKLEISVSKSKDKIFFYTSIYNLLETFFTNIYQVFFS